MEAFKDINYWLNRIFEDRLEPDKINCLISHAKKAVNEERNCVKPLLSDVLSELDKIDLLQGKGALVSYKRSSLIEKLGKYFR
jgi:hypothetical protein